MWQRLDVGERYSLASMVYFFPYILLSVISYTSFIPSMTVIAVKYLETLFFG